MTRLHRIAAAVAATAIALPLAAFAQSDKMIDAGGAADAAGRSEKLAGLFQQRMPLGQLMLIPGREPMPNRLFADLVLRHRRDDLVVHQ